MGESDRVRAHTDGDVQRELDGSRVDAVAAIADQGPDSIGRRIHELDREWDTERMLEADTERMLEANAASLLLASLALGQLVSRRWLVLTGVVPAFLLSTHSRAGARPCR